MARDEFEAARKYGEALEALRVMRDRRAGISGSSVQERLGNQSARSALQNADSGPRARLAGVDSLYRVYSNVPTKKVPVDMVPGTDLEVYMAVPVDVDPSAPLPRFPGSEWQAMRRSTMSEAGMLFVKKPKEVNNKLRMVYMAVGGPEYVRTMTGKDPMVHPQHQAALLEYAARLFGVRSTVSDIRDFYNANVKSLAKVQRGKIAAATAQATKTGKTRAINQTLRAAADGRLNYNKLPESERGEHGFAFGQSNWQTENGVCRPDRMTYKSGQTLNYTNLRQGRAARKSKRTGDEYEACTFGSMVPDVSGNLSQVAASRFGMGRGDTYGQLFAAAGNSEGELEATAEAYAQLQRATEELKRDVGASDKRVRSKLASIGYDKAFKSGWRQ